MDALMLLLLMWSACAVPVLLFMNKPGSVSLRGILLLVTWLAVVLGIITAYVRFFG